MKKRLGIALATSALAAGLIGGMSSGTPRHDARCAALHARAQSWHAAAEKQSDPKLMAQYNRRGDNLEAAALRCDNAGTTTTSTSGP